MVHYNEPHNVAPAALKFKQARETLGLLKRRLTHCSVLEYIAYCKNVWYGLYYV